MLAGWAVCYSTPSCMSTPAAAAAAAAAARETAAGDALVRMLPMPFRVVNTAAAAAAALPLQVESRSVVAAGALVPPGTTIPSGQVWAGAPAKFLRSLMEGERVKCWAALGWAALCCAGLVVKGLPCTEGTWALLLVVAWLLCDASLRCVSHSSGRPSERSLLTLLLNPPFLLQTRRRL